MKRFLLPVLLLIGGLVLGMGSVVAGAQVSGGSLPFMKPAEVAASKKPEVHSASGFTYPTKERIVNLADAGMLRYLKVTVVLEVTDPEFKGPMPKGDEYKKKADELAKELKPMQPIIDDTITAVLTAKTAADIMTPDGKQRLKDEIKDRLNKKLGEERVLSVYLTDFVIQ